MKKRIPRQSEVLTASAQRGFSLLEVMTALSLGSLIAGALFSSLIFIGRSSHSLSAYSGLSGQTRQGVEIVGRDIRVAADIVHFKPEEGVLMLFHQGTDDQNPKLITLAYYPNKRLLKRTQRTLSPDLQEVYSAEQSELFRGLEQFSFVGYNLNRLETSNPAEIKQVQMQLRLLDKRGQRGITEEIYSTRFILRNKG
ncbi:MAG: prepilin-type N-terminal cleavage/methylation domain-containing protein [Opitutales bacterium]|nr:prepilin-type N-terminal cleavage/methylation domain-containing protein [Opitutales bacterium]MCH8539818.1 prepilin-type N-terminal cleavage/methylation domain-containing protein [Opitutales bacterium]